jgi:hypothetical protein
VDVAVALISTQAVNAARSLPYNLLFGLSFPQKIILLCIFIGMEETTK